VTLPGRDDLGGVGGDGQASTQSGGLVVVIDQVVLAVDDLEAADLEADDLTRAAAILLIAISGFAALI